MEEEDDFITTQARTKQQSDSTGKEETEEEDVLIKNLSTFYQEVANLERQLFGSFGIHHGITVTRASKIKAFDKLRQLSFDLHLVKKKLTRESWNKHVWRLWKPKLLEFIRMKNDYNDSHSFEWKKFMLDMPKVPEDVRGEIPFDSRNKPIGKRLAAEETCEVGTNSSKRLKPNAPFSDTEIPEKSADSDELPLVSFDLQKSIMQYMDTGRSMLICTKWNHHIEKIRDKVKPIEVLWVTFSYYNDDIYIEYGYFSRKKPNKHLRRLHFGESDSDESTVRIHIPQKRAPREDDIGIIYADLRNGPFFLKKACKGVNEVEITCLKGATQQNFDIIWRLYPDGVKFENMTIESMKKVSDIIPDWWWQAAKMIHFDKCDPDMDFASIINKTNVDMLRYGSVQCNVPTVMDPLIDIVSSMTSVRRIATHICGARYNFDDVLSILIEKSNASPEGLTECFFKGASLFCYLPAFVRFLENAKFSALVELRVGEVLSAEESEWEKFFNDPEKQDILPCRPDEISLAQSFPEYFPQSDKPVSHPAFEDLKTFRESSWNNWERYTYVKLIWPDGREYHTCEGIAAFMYRGSRFIIHL